MDVITKLKKELELFEKHAAVYQDRSLGQMRITLTAQEAKSLLSKINDLEMARNAYRGQVDKFMDRNWECSSGGWLCDFFARQYIRSMSD